MVNNREEYCNICKKNTMFFLESDLLWYCDECGNVEGAIPFSDEEDENYSMTDSDEEDFYEISDGDENSIIIRCPTCNNWIQFNMDDEEDVFCPICYEDLSGEIEDVSEKMNSKEK